VDDDLEIPASSMVVRVRSATNVDPGVFMNQAIGSLTRGGIARQYTFHQAEERGPCPPARFSLRTIPVASLDLSERHDDLYEQADDELAARLAGTIGMGISVDLPIVVCDRSTPRAPRFSIVDGLRRARCARDAGLQEVLAVVLSATDIELLEVAVREIATQARRRAAPLKVAWAVQDLWKIAVASDPKCTNAALGRKLGLTEGQVSEARANAVAFPKAKIIELASAHGLSLERAIRIGREPLRVLRRRVEDPKERLQVLDQCLAALITQTKMRADNRRILEKIDGLTKNEADATKRHAAQASATRRGIHGGWLRRAKVRSRWIARVLVRRLRRIVRAALNTPWFGGSTIPLSVIRRRG
jgi:ParB-like chromosome segregation protein Spo0J